MTINCGKSLLYQIKKNPKLRTELELYRLSKIIIKNSNIAEKIVSAESDETGVKYGLLASELTALSNNLQFKGKSIRILVSLPGGAVIFDSSKGEKNTYPNFVSKSINENHNTRVAIISSQLDKCGVGYEDKFSTTTSGNEKYVAVCLGQRFRNYGTFRISYKV
jgi:hypothetical protein